MAEQIKGISIVFEGDTVSIDKSITALNGSFKALKQEFKNLNKELKLDPKNVEQLNKVVTNLSSQQKVVNERLAIYREELKKLQDSGDIGSKEWTKLYEEIQKNENLLKGIEDRLDYLKNYNLNRLNEQFEEFGKNLENAGAKVESVGKALVPVSATATAALSGATYAAIEFESAFAGVEKTVDATSEQLTELSSGIRQLALEIPATTTEISAVAQAAGQLGIETDNILEFSKVMIGLGEATNLTSDEAATMIAQFTNVTGLEGDYERLASTIVDLGNNTATTERDILELAQRLAGAASTANISEADILALSASMSALGINAEAGGSAMSKFISTIESEVAKGSDKMKMFAEVSGMTADEFANIWENEPVQAINDFIDGLSRIDASGGSAILVLEELGISEIRQRDALLRLSNAEGEIARNIDIANKAWEENVALAKETEKRYATTESQLAILKNTLNEVGLAFGEMVLPHVNKVISGLKDFLNTIKNLDPNLKKALLTLAGVTAVIAPVTIGIGKLMKVVGSLTALIGTEGLAGKFTALAGPIGAAIAAFALLWTTSEEFRTAIQNNLLPVIEKAFLFVKENILPLLMSLFEWFKQYIIPVLVQLTNTIGSALGSAITGFSTLLNGLIDLLSLVFDWLVGIWGWLGDLGVWNVFGSILEYVGGIINGVVGSLMSLFDWLGKVTGAIGSFLSGFADLVGKVGSGIGNAIGGLFSGGFGDIQSGGFSGNMNLTTNITVNTSRQITEQDTRKWAMSMVDVINEELGALV